MYKHTDVLEIPEHIFGILIKLPWETNYIFVTRHAKRDELGVI